MYTTSVRPARAGYTFLSFFGAVFLSFVISFAAHAQSAGPLKLSEAVDLGVKNFQSIQAKRNYLNASEALSKNARNEYLPNVIASVQQNYGTVNGQFGPLGAVGVLGVASAGPSYSDESWNAAFGALYIINANWEVFTFGRVQSRIQLADAQVRRDSADLEQEQFIHRVKISGAYLNLLVAQQFIRNAEANLRRAQSVQQNVRARALTGLNAGVDSSLANSEVSRAKLSLIEMHNNEQQVSNQLAQLLNTTSGVFLLDTTFVFNTPTNFTSSLDLSANPQVKFYQARIDQANSAARVAKRSLFPGVNLFGVYQARASGFDYNYTPEFPDRFTTDYGKGVNPSRYNYVAGVSIAWNLVSPLKVRQQVHAQRYVSEAYRYEFDQINTQLKNQLILSDQRIANSLQSMQEVPLQYRAASDAYLQKSVLYKNGLTTIVDLQVAMLALNKAEVDKSIAYVNVWQALLLKAAASGDFDLFINQAP
ncbi:TolC family protein [Chryseolinea lacunae]|uniref:TolC family protein n=1 Tax=Chryseolinea lacunae TaxID=2801331 RepID=A0ABS1KX22_9BACT|nr:TolC family protein [Chryseolinea lacunae]MBL0744014.1 TolC family protein [Chryseolinea lacunae]